MKRVQIKDGPLVEFPDEMSDEEIAKVLREHPPDKDQGTMAGTFLDVGRGVVGSQGIPGLVALVPRSVAGLVAAGETAVDQISTQSDRLWGRKDKEPKKERVSIGREWLDEIDRSMVEWDKTLDKHGPIGYTVSLGPIEGRIGRGIGGLIGGAAIPGGIAGQAAKGLSAVGRLGAAVKTGAAFGAAMEFPSVLASKDSMEFSDRALQLGVSTAVGGLLAGVMHGGVEATKFGVKRILALKNPEAVHNIDADLPTRIAALEKENQAFDAKRHQHIDEDRILIETAQSYVAARQVLGDRDKWSKLLVDVAKKSTVAVGKEEAFEPRKAAATALKELRSAARTVSNLDAEMETIAEVVAARGLPVGKIWTSDGKRFPLDERYSKDVIEQIQRRIFFKQEAMKFMDPAFMADEYQGTNLAEVVEEAATSLKNVASDKTKLLPGETAAVSAAVDEVLAKQGGAFQRAIEKGKKLLVDTIAELRGPMKALKPEARQVIERAHGENVTRLSMAADEYSKTLEANYTLEERQLPSLMSDPTGRGRVSEIVMTPKLKMMLEGSSRLYNKLSAALVRRGILNPNLFWEDYVPRIYDKKGAEAMLKLRDLRPLDAQNPHSFERTITDIFWAAQDHFDENGKQIWHAMKPRTLDISKLTSEYLHSMGRTSAHAEAVDRLQLVDPEAFRWITIGRKPNEIPAAARKPPDGFSRLPERFVNDSRPKGDKTEVLYVRNDVAKVLRNWHAAAWEGPRMAAFDKWNKWYKHVNLMVDLYHFWQLERGAAAVIGVDKMFGWGEGLRMLSSTHKENKLVQELINVGTLDPYRSDWGAKVYDASVKEIRRIPALSTIWDKTLGQYNEWLWSRVAPGLKVRIAVAKAHQLLETPGFAEKYSREELLRLAGTFANDVAGGQSWATHGRSAKFQSIANMITLAPDWMETRLNLLGKGVMGTARGAANKVLPDSFVAAHPSLQSKPQDVLYRGYWTGYMIQGLATVAAAQQMIYAAFPETRALKEKVAPGWKGFVSIVLPFKNRRGEALVMSPLPNLDYGMEATSDLGRFYQNRKSAAGTLVSEMMTGRDYTGRPYRPEFFSAANFFHTLGNVVPIPAGMVVGVGLNTLGAKPGSKDTSYEAVKGTLRSIIGGLHNHNEYPQHLRQEFEWLVGYDTPNTQLWVNRLSRFGAPGRELAKLKAKWHNDKVRDWFKEAQRTPYSASLIEAAMVRQKQLFITVPKN